MRIQHYIFGYGSLVCSKSRKITAPSLTKDAFPVLVKHIRREWTARLPAKREVFGGLIHGHTAMGIQRSHGHECTGVLIEVDSSELERFDTREAGYDRVEIDLEHIFTIRGDGDSPQDAHHPNPVLRKAYHRRNSSSLDSEQSSDSADETKAHENDKQLHINDTHEQNVEVKVWVYLPYNDTAEAADDKFPIMQSYVDIILRGCLSISEEFAVSFLKSTQGWSSEVEEKCIWVNDRTRPYYIRADHNYSMTFGHVVDSYLHKVHPKCLAKRGHLDELQSQRNTKL